MNIQRIRTSAAQLALMLEQHSMHELLRQQQDLAAQGLLMGTMIHELNNILIPLTDFMGGPAESIGHGSKAEMQEIFHEVVENVNRMKELTRAYTRLARQDFELLNVSEIIQKVATQMQPLAVANAISIIITLENKFMQIWGIQTHLEQILTNIILNAVQWIEEQQWQWEQLNQSHGQDAKARVHSTNQIMVSTCEDAETGFCCILISDTGPGISYPISKRVFDARVSTRKKGQGLGLFISRSLAEAMQGRLAYVDSIRFHGSLFAVVFPSGKTSLDGKKE